MRTCRALSDLDPLEVGQGADPELVVTGRRPPHLVLAGRVVPLAVVPLARGGVARHQDPPGCRALVGLAVMGREPVDTHRVARGELGRRPRQRRHDVGGDDAAAVGGKELVYVGGEPQTPRRRAALVDGNQDRHHPRRTGIRGQVLMGAESGPSGLLVVDLVLESHHVDTEGAGRHPGQRAPGQAVEAGVAGRHVLGPADGITRRRALGVLTPAVAPRRPCLDRGGPGLQGLEVVSARALTAGSVTPTSRRHRPRHLRQHRDPVVQGWYGTAGDLGGIIGTAELDRVPRHSQTRGTSRPRRVRAVHLGRRGSGCSRWTAGTGTRGRW